MACNPALTSLARRRFEAADEPVQRHRQGSYGPSNGQPDRRTARQRRYIPMESYVALRYVGIRDRRERGNLLRQRRRASLPHTATTRNCTRKRPRRRSALDTLTVLERLGSEQSTPGSCVPKCSASKPKRTSEQPLGRAGRATTGRTSLMAMQWALDAGGLLCGQRAGEHYTKRVSAA